MFQLQIYELFLKRQRKRKKNTQKIAVAMYEIAVPMCETVVAGSKSVVASAGLAVFTPESVVFFLIFAILMGFFAET